MDRLIRVPLSIRYIGWSPIFLVINHCSFQKKKKKTIKIHQDVPDIPQKTKRRKMEFIGRDRESAGARLRKGKEE